MRLATLVLGLIVLNFAAPAVSAREPRIEVKLITETAVPRPGQSFLIGLQMTPRPGWHGYWSNPGGSGLAPVGKWTAPSSVHFGLLQHPPPTLLRAMGVTSYVHAGPHILVARVRIDPSVRAGTTVPIVADLNWAACSDKLCVPEKARVDLSLKMGKGTPSAESGLLRRALAKVPKVVPGGSYIVHNKQIVLQLPVAARLKSDRARFFPDENGYWDASAAWALPGTTARIFGPPIGRPPERITGVVSDGLSAYRVALRRRG